MSRINGLVSNAIGWLGSGWYYPQEDPDSRDRKFIMGQIFCQTIITALVVGNFQTGLFLYAGADDAFIGTMAVITQAMTFLQIFFPMLLERFARRKKLMIGFRVAQLFFNVVCIGLIPLFPLEINVRLGMIALSVALASLTGGMFTLGASAWHMPFLSEKSRTGFYSVMHMVNTVLSALLNLGAGALVDVLESNGMEYEGMLILRGLALLVCGVEIAFDMRIGEKPYPKVKDGFSLKNMFLVPLRNRKFMVTVLVAAVYYFYGTINGNYYLTYLLDELDMSYTYVSLSGMVAIPVYLFLSRPIRKYFGHFPAMKKIWVFMLAIAVHWFISAHVNDNCEWLYAATNVYGYATTIGLNLGLSCLMFENLPDEGRSIYIAFYNMVVAASGVLGAAVGREFILMVPDDGIRILGTQFVDKQLLMLFVVAICIVSALVIRRLHKINERNKLTAAMKGEQTL